MLVFAKFLRAAEPDGLLGIDDVFFGFGLSCVTGLAADEDNGIVDEVGILFDDLPDFPVFYVGFGVALKVKGYAGSRLMRSF